MLLLEKGENESFSDVVSRLVKRRSKLSDSFGKWEMTDEQIQKFKSELHSMWQEWQLRDVYSDFLIDILAGKKETEHKMLEIENERLATTAINVFEILFGAEYSHNEKNIKEAHKILSGLDILTFDLEAAKEASRIQVQHMREGSRLPIRDLFIASVAKVHNCVVVTRNVNHFRISELEVETW